MKKQRHSNEFKVTAVKMANHPDIQTQDVAIALHIHPVTLSRWKKEYREGKLRGEAHPDFIAITEMESVVAERQRIRRLEEDLEKAETENDLLKRAIQLNLKRK